jgi:hypothetical protein
MTFFGPKSLRQARTGEKIRLGSATDVTSIDIDRLPLGNTDVSVPPALQCFLISVYLLYTANEV